MGQRQRHRLLDLDGLCWRLRADSLTEVQKNLQGALREQIAQEQFKRQSCWKEALAAGTYSGRAQLDCTIRLETRVRPSGGFRELVLVKRDRENPFRSRIVRGV